MAVPITESAIEIDGTAGQNFVAGNSLYLSNGSGGTVAGRWYLTTNAAYSSSAGAGKVGFATADALSGQNANVIRLVGRVTDVGPVTPGDTIYIDSASGAYTGSEPAMGTPRRVVGVADTTSSIVIGVEPPRSRVGQFLTTVGNVGAGEDVLFQYIAPAGELSADGMSYHVKAWGNTANNASGKTLIVHVIEGANDTTLLAAALAANEDGEWIFEADILRTAATTFTFSAMSSCGPVNGPAIVATNCETAQTATWANAITIRVNGSATSNNDITAIGGVVTRIP
jgi:hypothetical protein